jgi:hypothetical protein
MPGAETVPETGVSLSAYPRTRAVLTCFAGQDWRGPQRQGDMAMSSSRPVDSPALAVIRALDELQCAGGRTARNIGAAATGLVHDGAGDTELVAAS